MLSWWCRWLLIGTLGLGASIYAMDTVRHASMLPPAPKQPQKDRVKLAAEAIAKASQMDKVSDALNNNR